MYVAEEQRFAVKALCNTCDLAFLESKSLTMALRVNGADLAHGTQVITKLSLDTPHGHLFWESLQQCKMNLHLVALVFLWRIFNVFVLFWFFF